MENIEPYLFTSKNQYITNPSQLPVSHEGLVFIFKDIYFRVDTVGQWWLLSTWRGMGERNMWRYVWPAKGRFCTVEWESKCEGSDKSEVYWSWFQVLNVVLLKQTKNINFKYSSGTYSNYCAASRLGTCLASRRPPDRTMKNIREILCNLLPLE